jgi:hypothetical protein
VVQEQLSLHSEEWQVVQCPCQQEVQTVVDGPCGELLIVACQGYIAGKVAHFYLCSSTGSLSV